MIENYKRRPLLIRILEMEVNLLFLSMSYSTVFVFFILLFSSYASIPQGQWASDRSDDPNDNDHVKTSSDIFM